MEYALIMETHAPPRYTGQRLGELLIARGVKPVWLAREAGISRSQVSRIIRGSRTASDDVARRMADAVQVPVSLIFEEVKR